MKPTKVKVELKENWAKMKYAIFSTKDYNLAELDWPAEGRKEVRVYPNCDPANYIQFSCIPQGIIGAETACKTFLLEKGYYVTEFRYPKELKELRKQAFKIAK